MTPDQMTALTVRLDRLKKELSFLETHKPTSKEALVNDEFTLHAVERSLEVALESILDISRLVIALKNLPKPQTNAEIFDILGSTNVLPKEFANKIRGMGGMRNILVHDYMEIDYEKIYLTLNSLEDMRLFAEFVAKSLHA